MHKEIHKKVLIVGGGPVGLLCGLLCQKYKIPHLVVDKHKQVQSHPSAHYINMRSMEILSEIEGLKDLIESN